MDKLPSVMNHNFAQVPTAEIPRSSFNRSHGLKTTFDAGLLIPVFVDEALPGDTFNLSMTGFGRLATPLYPTMDNMFLDTFFFAVPNRLVWENWAKFNGEQENPGDSTDYVIPVVSTPGAGHTAESMADYFGLPTDELIAAVSALPFRSMNLIYNEWFRDENLEDSLAVDKDDGPDSMTQYPIRRRGKRHDYFTSCLPWPQKNSDGVALPLGISAPIVAQGATLDDIGVYSEDNSVYRKMRSDGTHLQISASASSEADSLYADLADATAATINELRNAFQIQKLYERDARGGTRLTEIIRSHFGVVSPDARMQRPEYLGGGTSMVNINPIAQTSSTDATSPQGNLAAMGTVSFNGHGFTKSFTEHCTIIGVACVRADLTYQQGVNRMWSRSTRWDHYWPALAHIGEQAVLNKEIYADGSANDDLTFGYQERFAEYKYKPSMVTGLFRSNHATSLDAWHLSQDFSSLPVLNDTFIRENPPIDRIVAVPTEPHFIFDAYFNLQCARPMPTFSVPGMIDHF